jgi:hypothetical protein
MVYDQKQKISKNIISYVARSKTNSGLIYILLNEKLCKLLPKNTIRHVIHRLFSREKYIRREVSFNFKPKSVSLFIHATKGNG